MSPSLERIYRRLLFTYPREYRRAREEEMVATLLDVSAPGQVLPTVRETAGLIAGGLRTRARVDAPRSSGAVWAEAIRIGAALTMASCMAASIIPALFVPDPRVRLLPLLLAATVAALLRWARRFGIVLLALDVFFGWPFQAYSVVIGGVVFTGGVGLATLSWITALSLPLALALAAASFVWYPSARATGRPWPGWLIALVVLVPGAIEVTMAHGSYVGAEVALHLHVPVSLFALVLPAVVLTALSLLLRNPAPALGASIYLGCFLGTMIYPLISPIYDPVIVLATLLMAACITAAGLSRLLLARA